MKTPAQIAAGLTDAQKWAILMIGKGRAQSPACLGEAMMERPGAMGGRTIPYKAQGYGRMGGTMTWRLWRKGLAEMSFGKGGNWHPCKTTLTSLGQEVVRAILKEQTDVK